MGRCRRHQDFHQRRQHVWFESRARIGLGLLDQIVKRVRLGLAELNVVRLLDVIRNVNA